MPKLFRDSAMSVLSKIYTIWWKLWLLPIAIIFILFCVLTCLTLGFDAAKAIYFAVVNAGMTDE